MNHLIWRLHRSQVYFAVAVLTGLAVIIVITGVVMKNDYHSFLATCKLTQSCSSGQGQLYSGDGAIFDLVNYTIVAPLLFGIFWGAPLVAKEFEDGTHNLIWTQGVTRKRWFSSQVFWCLSFAAAWSAIISVLILWWRIPENALGSRFDAFDQQGIVPVAYALFAVSLGIAVGSFVKRVLPSIATTLGAFVAVRLAIGVYVRPHFMTPLIAKVSLNGGGAPRGSWFISQQLVQAHGRIIPGGLTPGALPAACRVGASLDKGSILSCLASHGFSYSITYQPASRFWTFQGVESGMFVILAVGLIAFAYWRVLHRDA